MERGGSYIWSHPKLSPIQTVIYNPILFCSNKDENGFHITCKQVRCDQSTYIISSLTLMFPLRNSVGFALWYQRNENHHVLASIDINVKGKLT